MRLQDLTRYIDFDAVTEKLDRLQAKLGEVRDALPEPRKMREKLPSYSDIRGHLPFAPAKGRGSYTLPAALILGSAAALGAIAITSIAIRNAHRQVPKKNGDMA